MIERKYTLIEIVSAAHKVEVLKLACIECVETSETGECQYITLACDSTLQYSTETQFISHYTLLTITTIHL